MSICYTLLSFVLIIQFILIFLFIRQKNRTLPGVDSPKTENEKYRDLFENANDAIFILDKDHNYIDVNQRAVELFGYSREEFLRLNVTDVIPTSQRQRSDSEFNILRENGKYEKFVGKQKTKDGRWLDIEVNSSIIINDNKIIGSRDIVRDISERKKSEKEREALIIDLQKALAEINTLKGILPLCSFCKQVRDNNDKWRPIDEYIYYHSEADISHSVCPDCMKKHYSK